MTNDNAAAGAPLAGVRILEASLLGPAAITSSLVDLGAEVIKIESPAGDYIREMTWPIVEGVSLMHLHLNRGKRSIVLDLKSQAGVAIFKELAAGADAVIEAMRPGRWSGSAWATSSCARSTRPSCSAPSPATA